MSVYGYPRDPEPSDGEAPEPKVPAPRVASEPVAVSTPDPLFGALPDTTQRVPTAPVTQAPSTPVTHLPPYTGGAHSTPNGGPPAFGQPPVESFGRPPVESFGQPQVESYGQPPVESFGQPPVESFGQPPVESFGQPPVESFGQPPVESFGQPPAESFGQPPVESYRQSYRDAPPFGAAPPDVPGFPEPGFPSFGGSSFPGFEPRRPEPEPEPEASPFESPFRSPFEVPDFSAGPRVSDEDPLSGDASPIGGPVRSAGTPGSGLTGGLATGGLGGGLASGGLSGGVGGGPTIGQPAPPASGSYAAPVSPAGTGAHSAPGYPAETGAHSAPGYPAETGAHSAPGYPAETGAHSAPVSPAGTAAHAVPGYPAATGAHFAPVSPASTGVHSAPVSPAMGAHSAPVSPAATGGHSAPVSPAGTGAHGAPAFPPLGGTGFAPEGLPTRTANPASTSRSIRADEAAEPRRTLQQEIDAALDEPVIPPWDRRPLMVVIAAAAVLVLLAILSGVASAAMFPDNRNVIWQDPHPAQSGDGATPGTPSTPAAASQETITLSGVGDVIMGTAPSSLPPNNGQGFFDPVKSALASDLVMGNLETPLSDDTGVSKCGNPPAENCFQFSVPPSYANHLRDAGFQVLNLANNHTNDMGAPGLANTRTALKGVGILPTGGVGEITTVNVKGFKVAVLGFSVYSWGANLNNIQGAVDLVKQADADADLVVIQMQGGAEGSDKTHVVSGHENFLGEDRGDLITFTHAVIDAGADVVFGHGPHVMRGMEFYKGRLIAYSLGNFCGYKVLSSTGVLGIGGVLKVTLTKDGTWAGGKLVPTEMINGGQAAPDTDARALDLVAGLSRADFGAAAATISLTDGSISPPA